ncbi:polysaccharide export outer membrane protein [Meinhardsimonia xiamenensis]|uniref:Polysaccharide export outer membrane protein n=1 Tax=Meinhardsimonia xiamenensis TaxID=990712 RepID=A0A1G8Z783_9RHOB|nr:polysaccharide biosynthesis/export family protein [Meinhardsimonia xiamenensis]PRX37582.1 polysaccharide export outer membrane protein [Meinhardsimonia xiamenensis]SDK10888.1 polysaccharide export outer membrane protein [Meinhardsimonia xiamenensis]
MTGPTAATRLVRWLVAAGVALLTGCGAAYVSPDVREAAGPVEVQVVPVTPVTLPRANAVPYRPRTLPAAFAALAGASGQWRGAGALPEAAVPPEEIPAPVSTRLPPRVEDAPYRLGVGDVLLVTGLPGAAPDQTGGAAPRARYTVQDDGSIAIPSVGRVAVVGRTIAEAEEELARALLEAGLDPAARLEVAEFRAHRAVVGGAVRAPRAVAIGLQRPTLAEVLAAAGGVEQVDERFAVVRLFRDGRLYEIPLSDIGHNASVAALPVLAGDVIFVDEGYDLERARAYFEQQIRLAELRQEVRARALAELEAEIGRRRAALEEARRNFLARVELDAVPRDHVYLAGEVAAQGRFALPFERQASLADALFGEGGVPTETGNPSQIYVLRAETADGSRVTAWHLDARNAANLVLATRFELRPNDVIFVAEQPITRWHRVLRQFVPALITSGVSAASN